MGKRSRKMPKTFNSFVLELETDYVQYVSRLGIVPMAAGQTKELLLFLGQEACWAPDYCLLFCEMLSSSSVLSIKPRPCAC